MTQERADLIKEFTVHQVWFSLTKQEQSDLLDNELLARAEGRRPNRTPWKRRNNDRR